MTEREQNIAILTYHSLDHSGSVISTAPEKFCAHIKALHQSNISVLGLHEIADCLSEDRPFPPNSVSITFDDGFRSVFDVALPVLKEYDYPATVFLVTDFCGKNNAWYGQPGSIPVLDLLSWDEVGKMAGSKIEFGVHTASHPDLTAIPSAKIEDEILGAQETLRQHVKQNGYAFAYPYGKRSSLTDDLIRNHFYAACSTKMDFASLKSDVHFLPRLDMYYFSRNNRFSAVGTSSFKRFVQLRKTLRELRETIAGH